jgi:hypothetical protein
LTKLKFPEESDIALRRSDVPIFVRVTEAPGIVALLGSVTVPTMEPKEVCATSGPVAMANKTSREQNPMRRRKFIDALQRSE